jgi:aryl sulfotransferase
VADLESRMHCLADWLDIGVDPRVWPSLVDGARFASMRDAANVRTPDQRGVFKDPAAFFRRGTPGAGREVLGDRDLAAYEETVRDLLAAEDVDDPAGVLWLLNVG